MGADVLTFLGIVVVLAVTPGADMALVMRNVLGSGFRALWPTMAGIVGSLAVHITLCVALVARAGAAIKGSPRTRRRVEGSTGAALVDVSVRLAAAGR
jgi:threonine/homoserine/homoserine lactone efflux protein